MFLEAATQIAEKSPASQYQLVLPNNVAAAGSGNIGAGRIYAAAEVICDPAMDAI
jgi:hypothetical protein